jgi:hypothetical protein
VYLGATVTYCLRIFPAPISTFVSIAVTASGNLIVPRIRIERIFQNWGLRRHKTPSPVFHISLNS